VRSRVYADFFTFSNSDGGASGLSLVLRRQCDCGMYFLSRGRVKVAMLVSRKSGDAHETTKGFGCLLGDIGLCMPDDSQRFGFGYADWMAALLVCLLVNQ